VLNAFEDVPLGCRRLGVAVNEEEAPAHPRRVGESADSRGARRRIEAYAGEDTGIGERPSDAAPVLWFREHRIEDVEGQARERQVAGAPAHPAADLERRFSPELEGEVVEQEHFVPVEKADLGSPTVAVPVVRNLPPYVRRCAAGP